MNNNQENENDNHANGDDHGRISMEDEKVVEDFLTFGKKQMNSAKELFDLLVASKMINRGYEAETILKEEYFLKSSIFMKNLIILLGCTLSSNEAESMYGAQILSDYDLFFHFAESSSSLSEAQILKLVRQRNKLLKFIYNQSETLVKSWELPDSESVELERYCPNEEEGKSQEERKMEALAILHLEADEIIQRAITDHLTAEIIPQMEDPQAVELCLGCSIEFLNRFIRENGGHDKFQNLTTGEVCQKFIQGQAFLKRDEVTLSFCQYLKENPRNKEYIGKADYFISHAWGYPFLELVAAIKFFFTKSYSGRKEPMRELKLWIDIFSSPQPVVAVPLTVDWLSNQFKSVMRSIGKVAAVFLGGEIFRNTFPFGNYLSLSRIWCLFELYSAINLDIELEIVVSETEFISTVNFLSDESFTFYFIGSICRLADSRATVAADKDCIIELITNSIGCETFEYFLSERLILAKLQFCVNHMEIELLSGQDEDNQKRLALFYRNLGEVYFYLNQYDEAANYFESSFQFIYDRKVLLGLCDIYFITNKNEKLFNLVNEYSAQLQGHIFGDLTVFQDPYTLTLAEEEEQYVTSLCRISREIKEYFDDMSIYLSEGIVFIVSIGNSKVHYEAIITGPEGTPYENGTFKLQIIFPRDSPFRPIRVVFKTPVFHCNINRLGRISLDILNEQWSPSLMLSKILISIRSLLADPNPHEGYNMHSCYLFKTDRAKYDQIAREWTEKYAIHRKMINGAEIVDVV